MVPFLTIDVDQIGAQTLQKTALYRGETSDMLAYKWILAGEW